MTLDELSILLFVGFLVACIPYACCVLINLIADYQVNKKWRRKQ